MTIRNTILAAVLAAVLGAPVALAGQDYELPDSVAWLQLPTDPNEFVRLVATGERSGWDVFAAGCPSEGGWAGAAFAAMTEAAETDPHIQRELAQKLGHGELARAVRQKHGRGDLDPQCPSEHPRYEAWLAAQLRREWERGLLAPDADGMGRSVVVGTLLSAIVWGTEASTRDLVRDIARDPAVWEPWREDAAQRLVDLYFGEGDTGGRRDVWDEGAGKLKRYRDAYRSVALDLAAGAPLSEYGPEIFRIARGGPGAAGREAFEREYERVLRAAGREPFWR